MGDLTRNFSRWEFACFCGCGFDTVDYELVVALQELRDYYNQEVDITPKGGCRCPRLNNLAGGAENSLHLYGRAADFSVAGVRPQEVQAYLTLKYPGRFGLGRYSTFTHLDTRTTGPARWDLS